jgi:bifunctional DNase/RNase
MSHQQSKYIPRCFSLIIEIIQRKDKKIEQVFIEENLINPFTKTPSQ